MDEFRRPEVGPDRQRRAIRFGLGLGGVFLSTVVLALAVLAAAAPLVPRWEATVVSSGSMEPALRRGDVVVFADHPIEQTGVGTVVVFDGELSAVVHRVVDVNDDGTLVTRGDANRARDSGAVDATELRGAGELVVPFIGLPRVWLAEGRYDLVGAAVAGLALALWSARLTSDAANDPWRGVARPSPATVWLTPLGGQPA